MFWERVKLGAVAIGIILVLMLCSWFMVVVIIEEWRDLLLISTGVAVIVLVLWTIGRVIERIDPT